jgi:hypothetical protein
MTPRERDVLLENFFGGYFDEDWDVRGAATWRDVVVEYRREHGAGKARLVRDALAMWLEETRAEPGANLPPKFGCDYDPRPDGLTERQWVEQIVEELSLISRG